MDDFCSCAHLKHVANAQHTSNDREDRVLLLLFFFSFLLSFAVQQQKLKERKRGRIFHAADFIYLF